MLFQLTILALMVTATVQQGCDTYIEELDVTCPLDQNNTAVTYADPEHCSQYWECWNGCATHLVCQNDYLYDDIHGWCNYPNDVVCGDRDCDGRPCKPNPTTLHPYDVLCPERNGFFAYPDNCIKYIICAEFVPSVVTCPKAGTGEQELYDPQNEWCDYPDRVNCGDRPICDAQDENCDATTTTETPPCADVVCTSDGFYPEGICEPCVCQCFSGNTYETCCSSGLFWNTETNACEDPDGITGCQ